MPTAANFSWVPSSARVVTIDGFGAFPRGSWTAPSCSLVWPAKDPSETLDYVLDISQALCGNDGDSISTLDIAISPTNAGDLVVQSSSADGTQAILWLTAGFAGTTYAVTVTIGTNSGRIIARTVNLPVVILANQAGTSGAITDQTGAPITTESGAPIVIS